MSILAIFKVFASSSSLFASQPSLLASSSTVEESLTLYRPPGERLGLGLRFDGGAREGRIKKEGRKKGLHANLFGNRDMIVKKIPCARVSDKIFWSASLLVQMWKIRHKK